MANSRLHGPTGNTCLVIDNQTLARTQMHSSGSIGTDDGLSKAELERQKREIALDLAQLILDLTGIVEPTPVSDGTNTLISIARGNWFDAAISAISIVPYIGDLSKVAKLPRYLDSIRKAIRIARVDAAWRPVLKDLFKKIKTILDRILEEAGDKLPLSALKTLKAIKKEIDDFLGANISAMAKADSPASAPSSATSRQAGGGSSTGGSPSPKGRPPKEKKAERSNDKMEVHKVVSENTIGSWRLVGANRAQIDPRKLKEYALNSNHPIGGNKAKVFESALGFDVKNADDLMKQLQEGIMKHTPSVGKVDKYGSRFTVDIPVVGPKGSGTVRTGWIYKPGSSVPELTTLFVK